MFLRNVPLSSIILHRDGQAIREIEQCPVGRSDKQHIYEKWTDLIRGGCWCRF
jgi:hypothetical protein